MRRRNSRCPVGRFGAGLGVALVAGVGPLLGSVTLESAERPLWSGDGHQIVCQIAWERVTEVTRSKIAELIARDPSYVEFAPSCTWADDIRAQIRDGVSEVQRFRRFTTAHYLNSPPGRAGVDLGCLSPSLVSSGELCILAGIKEVSDSLARGSDAEIQLESLKFLGHFVGDLHQPLHAGYGEDLGGNSFRVSLMGIPDQSLHGVWDFFFLEHGGRAWNEVAADLAGRITPVDERLWSVLDPVTWADESYQLVEREVYADLEPTGDVIYVGQRYYDRHLLTVERQLMKAGVRLALLLDQLLDP